MRRQHGFTLIEVLISGVLLAMLMLAVMGVLSQAQRDMKITSAQTEVTEKTRQTMEAIARELRESSINMLVAGYRGGTSPNFVVRNVLSFPGERDMAQCPDQYCPWHYNTALAAEREPHTFLTRNVQMNADGNPFNSASPETWLSSSNTSTVGRIWANVSSSTQCAAGHTYTSTTTAAVQMGAIMFATPRNREGRFVSLEGANRATDWQGLVFLVPYSAGANIVQLRRYVLYVDDIVHDDGLTAWNDTTGVGVVAAPAGETVTTLSGSGASNGAYSTNNPAGKPTMTDLLDYDGDGAIADGVFDLSGGTEDATAESFDITTSGTQSFITYVKTGNAGGGSYSFSVTIDRDSGEITCAVNHTYGAAGSAAYQKTVNVRNRRPQVVASNIRDIEFATIRNCPYEATDNPTGLVSPQDMNVVRVTAFFDKALGIDMGSLDSSGNRVVRAGTSQEVVVTRVQPRN